MPELLETKPLRLSSKKIRGRAINAVAEMLRHQLSIPHIYLDPEISGVPSPHVLAVDRAGSGDLHAVVISDLTKMPTRALLRSHLDQMMTFPFHFKYLALPHLFTAFDSPLRFAELPELFDESGIGRIGILAIDSTVFDSSSGNGVSAISVVVRPERFRVKGKGLAAIEKFLDKTAPDISVRI